MAEREMISVFIDAIGLPRIRCDAPGERAVSAVIQDPLDLIRMIAERCPGVTLDEPTPGSVTVRNA